MTLLYIHTVYVLNNTIKYINEVVVPVPQHCIAGPMLGMRTISFNFTAAVDVKT